MNEVMEGINSTSERVSIGASELASAAQLIAESSELQAASVEQLAATTNTVADHVEESHRDAEASAKETDKVTAMIEQNQEKMTMMMDAMNEIRQTSQQVVGIIQTIEEIADQTNLLSLNASIEVPRRRGRKRLCSRGRRDWKACAGKFQGGKLDKRPDRNLHGGDQQRKHHRH